MLATMVVARGGRSLSSVGVCKGMNGRPRPRPESTESKVQLSTHREKDRGMDRQVAFSIANESDQLMGRIVPVTGREIRGMVGELAAGHAGLQKRIFSVSGRQAKPEKREMYSGYVCRDNFLISMAVTLVTQFASHICIRAGYAHIHTDIPACFMYDG
jgi:hypothetical protein